MMKSKAITKVIWPLLIPAASIALASCGQAADKAAGAPDNPNIILILVDDMGYGDAGFNGCTDIPTPHIDRIAANGVRFTDGYVTAPQCAPSRAGMLSGIAQNRFGCDTNADLDNFGIPPGIKLFGDYLQPAGYRTGLVGKWHLGTMESAHPLVRGFDWFWGFLVGGSHFFPQEGEEYIPRIFEGREVAKTTNYLTTELGHQAVRFIQESGTEPFFLFLSFNAPHAPLQAPEAYLEKFKHLAVEGEPGLMCGYTKRLIQHPRQVYAAMVSVLDDAIGLVMESLRAGGIEENTLVVFLSDNGGPTGVTSASNEPLRGVKGDLLEGGIRVPFAIQWKSVIPAGQTIHMPVSSLDLLPTFLAAAEIPPPSDVVLDGDNLLPILTGEKEPYQRTLTWRFPFPPESTDLYVWGIRHGNWKLVKERIRPNTQMSISGKTHTGLYLLDEDITETNDLSISHKEIRNELQLLYDAWDVQLPEPDSLGRRVRR